MNLNLIEFFGVALSDEPKADAKLVNEAAAKRGYIIHPDCCTKSVYNWLNSKSTNINSTFYKSFHDVSSKDRLDLFFDQMLSYASTYLLGENLTMNDGDYSMVPNIRKYKVILPITQDELYDKCLNVLISGIPLKSDTISALGNYIYSYVQDHKIDFTDTIDLIKNREAQTFLCDVLSITPTDKFALLRYIYYKVTGETMIVKDSNILRRVTWGNKFDMNYLSEKQLEGLASIFYRYKPIFLGLKKYDKNKYIINRLRRMAKALHQPMEGGFWETILSKPYTAFHIKDMIKRTNPSNFKLIQLIQAINDNQMKVGGMGDNIYMIRNGKMWIKDVGSVPALDPKYDYWDILKEILYQELVNRLKAKACTVKFPEHLNLTCPTSEKNFVGNIPFGSYYDFTEHNMIGIYWKAEWGTYDFDLSFNSFNGLKVGWNERFYDGNKRLIYSGDVTYAEPEGAEVVYMAKGCPDGLVKVNRYSGEHNSKFVFHFAQNEVKTLSYNYMIDPNTIQCQTDIISDSVEKMVGFVIDNRFYVCDIRTGNSRVSRAGGKTVDWKNTLKRKGMSYINLKQLLLDAGFKERKRSTKDNPIMLDLSDLKKDTLIELFSE